ncbi:uncharacterized protein F4807DRAFT_431956 [Annulohypoxylon truncatum]|uniref:uncharacterized protein n=1 Tax=Annulohypoxylon truncatum TaxID=327061 RepID=UPI002007BE53|nr:uncharacterized protein F4807DRAFT_431956 [Annulohypoxylon truncatum]KAI1208195.1 hypothetical protein F4807DRAFT_431956 [Annulohypoxylon truncatum]
MDDQFNGRTDDDLFADDFEPVEAQQDASATISGKEARPVAKNESHPVGSAGPPASAVQSAPAQHAPRSLDQSRHANTKPAPSSSSPHHHQRPRKHSPKPAAAAAVATPPESPHDSPHKPASISGGGDSTSNPNPSPLNSNNGNNNGAGKKGQSTSPAKPGQNTALADRLASGANPRTKLTDSELAAKMEQMRLLAAEKTRRFEQAERDSRSHAVAYEKGMEEARKRRAEDVERRRKGAEERRRMDEERAANRERKLKAMGAKEGGSWDEGKTLEEERERRAGFRSANGGIRGARNTGGIAGSRFAERDGDAVPREFGFDDFRGRGRGGRGRGGSRGGGRGGRGGFNNEGRPSTTQNGNAPQQQKAAQAPPAVEDFPALPTPKKLDTTTKAADTSALSPSLNSPPIGKWDDEMAALDDKA